MSIATVVTRGYGIGSIADVVFRGYSAAMVVVVPATTAGGGRKHRIRHSRAMVYAPFVDSERKKHQQEIKAVQKDLQERAKEIARAEQIEIEQARTKALEALLLSQSVNRVRITSDRLIKAISDDTLSTALKTYQTDQALLAILLAAETYEV